MDDYYRIEGQKLTFHISRLNQWQNGKDIYPIYIEISPSGVCNHRCLFCAFDYMEYQPRFLDTKLLKDRLYEMANLGIKSIMYAGEGEPLLHKNIGSIINHTRGVGIDIALTTNGVLLNKELLDETLGNITWIKVSINGATKETYAKIHKTRPQDFDRAIENLSYTVRLKKTKGYKCTLGIQVLLLPENCKEILPLAKKAKDMGLDYLVVKPYSHHPFSKTTRYKNINYSKYLHLADKVEKLNSDNFNVIFRIHTMKKWDRAKRDYRHCYALSFWSYIDAEGNVWACSAYLGDKRFLYGNIYKNTFQEIWQGSRRKEIHDWAGNNLDTNKCRLNCRMDEINRYLWELKNPCEHVNFI